MKPFIKKYLYNYTNRNGKDLLIVYLYKLERTEIAVTPLIVIYITYVCFRETVEVVRSVHILWEFWVFWLPNRVSITSYS